MVNREVREPKVRLVLRVSQVSRGLPECKDQRGLRVSKVLRAAFPEFRSFLHPTATFISLTLIWIYRTRLQLLLVNLLTMREEVYPNFQE
ncbi:hypothetical protein D3C75_1281530 [compost metagenome]